jgi:SRSO17 transposase
MPSARRATAGPGRVAVGPPALEAFLHRIGLRFSRAEPRRRARLFVYGVLAGPARKNGWTLAEFAGDPDLNGMQRLLTSARWDADGVRDDLRDWLLSELGGPDAVVVPTEVAVPRKGTQSVGVHRRFSGQVGRTVNVQEGLFLTYARGGRYAFVDRELYLPRSWTADPQRCARLGVPDGHGYASKAELARQMIERVLAGPGPRPWVGADASYGDEPALRAFLDQRGLRYVVGVRRPESVPPLPQRWEGDWGLDGGGLLVQRSPTGPRYHVWHAAPGTPLRELARVGAAITAARQRTGRICARLGLDQYRVRRYDAWYRHVTLCLVAGGYLTLAS